MNKQQKKERKGKQHPPPPQVSLLSKIHPFYVIPLDRISIFFQILFFLKALYSFQKKISGNSLRIKLHDKRSGIWDIGQLKLSIMQTGVQSQVKFSQNPVFAFLKFKMGFHAKFIWKGGGILLPFIFSSSAF